MIALTKSNWIESPITHKCFVSHCMHKIAYMPMCTRHLKTVYGVEIKQTILVDNDMVPYRFLGLFATRDFKRGEFILPYLGEIVNMQTVNERYGFTNDTVAPYVLQMDNDTYIDAMHIRSAGGMANMCQSHDTMRSGNKLFNNAKFKTKPEFYPYMEACKKIRIGDEIFVNYGDTYFK